MSTTSAQASPHPTTDVLFFDGTCSLCSGLANRWRDRLERHGVTALPMSEAPDSSVLPEEMKLVRGNRTFGGADAWIELASCIWWARPLGMVAAIPGVRVALRCLYRAIARRRHCLGGACELPAIQERAWIGWLPLLALPTTAIVFRSVLSDWAFMWIFAFTIFAGFKWRTWWRVRKKARSTRRVLGYLFGWVGMDAERFLDCTHPVAKPGQAEWLWAAGKTLIGVALLFLAALSLSPNHLLLRGWCGLLGLVFLLHFGLFHLLALAWRAAGVDAQPIMRAPALATSLTEFWSKRWNVAFHQLAERELFKPLLRRINPALAMLVTFVFSGLIHDAVISFPARGGYGLPTCYFVLQGIGILFERSALGKSLRGWRSRVFTWFITIGPVPLLFHGAFIRNIISPFLQALAPL